MMDELRNEQENEVCESCECEHGCECGAGQPEDTLAQDLAACEDKYLRLRAEYDNFRKRSQKERESVYSFALAEAVGAFIPVIDNIERACSAPNADEGIKMIMRQLEGILERLSVRPLGQPGECFDPNFHNAVAHEGDAGESVISEVLQKGYAIEERLIRPAMVKTTNGELLQEQ